MTKLQNKQERDQLNEIILKDFVPGMLNNKFCTGESLDYKRIFAFISANNNGVASQYLEHLKNSQIIRLFNWDDTTWEYIYRKPYSLQISLYYVKNSLKNTGFDQTAFHETNNAFVAKEEDDTNIATKEEKSFVPTSRWVEVERFLSAHFDFRNNTVAHTIEYKKKSEAVYKELNENSLHRFLQIAGVKFSLTYLRSLISSDYVRDYDPIQEYFNSLPDWDGNKDYINELANFVKATDQVAFNLHLKKMLVRTVSCALNENYYNKQAFILVGHEQNTGKSTWIRNLCPAQLNKYLNENMTTDKDTLMCLYENFIINLDELEILDKKEINYIKSLLSKDRVKVRRPFATRATTDKRRASFFGSTNKDDFLTDETGSVRWLCFEIESIDFSYSDKVDINLVWGQAFKLFKTGFKYELTAEEVKQNELRNAQFQKLSI